MKIEDTVEELTVPFKPTSRPGTLKRKALEYLGKLGTTLSRKDIKEVELKAKKMKKSSIKAERSKSHKLAKEIDFIE